MEPAYMNMQSYPNQKDQLYYGPHYYPGMEASPTQMYVNPARPPMDYGYWPWGSNCGGSSPIGCHGCYNHSYFPAHCAWGSPYSHVQPHHCPGSHPHLPVQYVPPPPYYAMEQPRYEYKKNMPREHHCCGCLNQPLHQKEQRNVRIEEEEPERERRKDDSVIPFQSKNSPYPIVWLPPDYVGNKVPKVNNTGDGKDGSCDVKVHEKDSSFPIVWLPPDYSSNKEQGNVKSTGDGKDGSRDRKAHENGKFTGQQPVFWNGWLPFDLNNLVPMKDERDGEENHQQDDCKRNFPFPLFWMPYKPEEEDSEKHMVKDANTTQGSESETGSGGEQSFHVRRENIGEQAASKVRDIPVKEGGHQVEKETSIKQEKERDASIKDTSDSGEKKVDIGEKVSHKEGSKRKSSSPPKSSKLPPVCLRVDPLPRRKNGNGSSRCPSPPGSKQKPDSQPNDASKVLNSSEKKEQDKILQNGLKKDEGTKTIENVDGRTSHGKATDVKMVTPVKLPAKAHDYVSENQSEEKFSEEHIAQKHTANDAVIGQSEDAGSVGGENEGSLRAQEMKADEVKKSCKRELSEEQAAVIIQSAYRGFDVRRWEPIKKLKQIGQVCEQIADVKRLIQVMKSSTDIQGRNKQRNIVAETIMGLLLKLDIIQGLHPSIREIRKSVVRELVSLQEQLDSVANEEPENSPREEPMMTCDEDALNKIEDATSPQSDHEIAPTYLLEEHKNQIDGGSNHEKSEISEVNLIGEAGEKIEKEAAPSSTNNIVDSAPEPMVNEEGQSNVTTPTDLQAHQNQIDGEAKHDSSLVLDTDQVVEEVSREMEKEVPESSMNKDVESASEPTIEEGEKSSEVPESDEKFSKEFRIDLVIGQGSEVLSLQDNSSAKAADIAATDSDTLGNDLIELPVGVLDEFFGQEGPHNVTIEVDASKTNQVKQLEEALVESPIILERHEAADDKDGNRTFETHEVLDAVPPTVDSCNADDRLGSEEEVDGKTGDARIEPVDIGQQVQNLIEENNEARDMIRVEGAAEDKSDDNGNDSDNCTTQQSVITEIKNSGEVTEQKQPQITEDSQTHSGEEPTDLPQQGEEFNESREASEEKQPQITEDSQTRVEESVDVRQQGEECSAELKEAVEEQGLKDASADEENAVDPTSFEDSPARNEVTQSNQKLIEENERLREMMEKLLKSGQEQITAISSLSGRVKDLEKKLARKKKLKVKQYRCPRSGSSCMTNFDGVDNKRTFGVAKCRGVV